MNAIQQRVVDRLNREIGNDVNNLSKSEYVIQGLKQQLIDIEAKLSLKNHLVDSSTKSVLRSADTACESIEIQKEKIVQFQKRIIRKANEYETVLDGVSDALQKEQQLEHLVEYFKILTDIQDISNALKSVMKNKDDSKIVGLYLSLFGELNSCNSVIGRLENIEAYHLKSFANRTANYWYDVLQEKFTKDFESILKIIKWPNVSSIGESLSSEPVVPSRDSLNKLSGLAENLFLIKSPCSQTESYVEITPSILCAPLSIPTQLLIKPYRQRFMYHFTGQRQTNRLDKPEWFFTQILIWARDNHTFVSDNLQQSAILAGHENLNIRLEFIRGLVQLTIEKLCMDIEEISHDEHLFAHLLDETLSFEQELNETLGYPNYFPSAISVLTQAQYLTKWLSIEEKFSTGKMDIMFQDKNIWQFIDRTNIEELKIPKCSDQFVRLLDAIKERYCSLPQPGHQLQFLNLQLELIDNFRRRLVQLHTTTTSDNVNTTKVLNAINYLNSVLREWGENVHYLHLHAALVGPNADEINSVFDRCVDELEHWQRKLLKDLVVQTVDEIKAKTMRYRHDNWVSMPEQNANEPFILSVTAGEMFQQMVTILHVLESDLSTNLFNIIIRMIANQLDDFFIDSMIMNTKFSYGGSIQFQFDMTRNLFALFGQYARRPDLLFKKIHDACILLTLPTGNALLLYDTIRSCKNLENASVALKEVRVNNIQPKLACYILERRKEITRTLYIDTN